jgi:carboxymethylenebutenolidase
MTMLIQQHTVDLTTASGLMRTTIFRPAASGRFNAIIFYSEIFQLTAPIARSAAILAGHGFVVLVPEIFHELNPIGTVLAYDDVGKDKGNADKFAKPLEQHDSDTQAMIDYLSQQAFFAEKVFSMGVCIGGHLAFRAALNPKIKGAYCLYPTDLHSATLPCDSQNQTLSRCAEISGSLVLVFGKQDPHVSAEGRDKIRKTLQTNGCDFSWHEVKAQHAFMRDEGERYDPMLALQHYSMAINFFRELQSL